MAFSNIDVIRLFPLKIFCSILFWFDSLTTCLQKIDLVGLQEYKLIPLLRQINEWDFDYFFKQLSDFFLLDKSP